MTKQKRTKQKRITIEKPCHKLGYCPYGPLVEDFLLKSKPTEISCKVFGHDCPVFSVAEGFKE